MLPARYAPILYGFILSGAMSLLVSGVATLKATGLVASYFAAWISAWSFCWPVAFASTLMFAPVARRLVARLTRPA